MTYKDVYILKKFLYLDYNEWTMVSQKYCLFKMKESNISIFFLDACLSFIDYSRMICKGTYPIDPASFSFVFLFNRE